MRTRLAPMLGLCLLIAASPHASRAAALTLEDAQAVEGTLRNWLTGLLGPEVRLPSRPVQLTPEGDHYRELLPIPGLEAEGGSAPAPGITGLVRPQGNGRWAVEDIRLPSPAKLSIPLPGDAAPLGSVEVLISAGAQDSKASFDVGLATPSRLDMQLEDFAIGIAGPNQREAQHLDHYTLHMTVQPGAGGRLDVGEEMGGEGFRSEQQHEGLPPVSMQADRVRLSAQVDGLNRDRAGPLLVSSVRFIGALLAGLSNAASGDRAAMPPLDRDSVRAVLLALNDIATGGHVEESVENLHVKVGDVAGALDRARFEMGAASPQGMLNAWLALTMEGLSVPGLPVPASEWLPRRIILRPSISGVSLADLTRFAMRATEPNTDPHILAPEIAALFSHGGVTVGIDALAFDVGPSAFEGSGKLLLLGPDDLQGQARITATGMEALLASAAKDPDLAPLLGGLTLAVQLAKREQGRMVWNVAMKDGTITVNGVDPTQPPRPAPPPATRRQPDKSR